MWLLLQRYHHKGLGIAAQGGGVTVWGALISPVVEQHGYRLLLGRRGKHLSTEEEPTSQQQESRNHLQVSLGWQGTCDRYKPR